LYNFQCEELAIFGRSFEDDWRECLRGTSALLEPSDSPIIYNTFFSNLTHLRLFDNLSAPYFTGKYIASLPRLTHFAVPFYEHIDYSNPFFQVSFLLQAESSLSNIVILINYRTITPLGARMSVDDWAVAAEAFDPRLYVVIDDTRESQVWEWEMAARGSESIWERAQREHEERINRLCS
jgi:hypothetical protein